MVRRQGQGRKEEGCAAARAALACSVSDEMLRELFPVRSEAAFDCF